MSIAKLGAVLLAGVLSVAAVPAFASPVTDTFLANVGANVGFLTESSRFMAEKSGSAMVRNFARSEISEQTKVAEALVRLAPAFAMASPADAVATGRSAAVDEQPRSETSRSAVPVQAANNRQALGQVDLDQLRSVSGPALDDLYWQKQLDALSQLESDYRTYIAIGDDPVLVAVAKADLPRVMKRLEALTKI